MSTHSLDGREWARLSQLKPGDTVIADGGFTCIPDGARLQVCEHAEGGLCVPCAEGGHHLDGQLFAKDNDHLVGLWPAT